MNKPSKGMIEMFETMLNRACVVTRCSFVYGYQTHPKLSSRGLSGIDA